MSILLVLAVTVARYGLSDFEVARAPGELLKRFVQSLHTNSVFDLLTSFVIFSSSLFYMLAVLAVIVLRFRFPQWERPYRTWGYPFVPLAFLAVYVWFMAQVYIGSPLVSRVGLFLIALGLPAYWIYQRLTR